MLAARLNASSRPLPDNEISATQKSFAAARGLTECDFDAHNSQPQPASTSIRDCEHKGALPSFETVAALHLAVPQARNIRRVSPLMRARKLMLRMEDKFGVTLKWNVGPQPRHVGAANRVLLRRRCYGDPAVPEVADVSVRTGVRKFKSRLPVSFRQTVDVSAETAEKVHRNYPRRRDRVPGSDRTVAPSKCHRSLNVLSLTDRRHLDLRHDWKKGYANGQPRFCPSFRSARPVGSSFAYTPAELGRCRHHGR
jgi:hypothetical protein